ncbi:hypothetical protein Salat_0858000 [Sesamum alatum]|uniref:Uncharacterized protein n=1 Tax=Sesamum alatum TaxID=300844 RepID=A0AAE1YIR3_9LAMI|nr:hypothetical protein Salat_0858000 [Sesamum alatum]
MLHELLKMPMIFALDCQKTLHRRHLYQRDLLHRRQPKKPLRPSPKSTKHRLHPINEEEEEEVNFTDTDEEYLNCYISNNDKEDKKSDDNDNDDGFGNKLELE